MKTYEVRCPETALTTIGMIFVILFVASPVTTFAQAAPSQQTPTMWTDKSTYGVGETVTITMAHRQMMGVEYWVIVYKPDGSSLNITFAQNSNSVTTTADEAGEWRVALWNQLVVYPNPPAGLLGTCTFTVTSTTTVHPCPMVIIEVDVSTSKPIYNVGDEIVVLWGSLSPGGGLGNLTGVLTLTGPSGTYQFNIDSTTMGRGQYDVGKAEQKDIGTWTVSFVVNGPSGCPPLGIGSTTFQVGPALVAHSVLVSAIINGISLDIRNPRITVSPNSLLSGTMITAESDTCSFCVLPVVGVNSWDRTYFADLGMLPGDGLPHLVNYTFSFAAPAEPGIYYVAIIHSGCYTATDVVYGCYAHGDPREGVPGGGDDIWDTTRWANLLPGGNFTSGRSIQVVVSTTMLPNVDWASLLPQLNFALLVVLLVFVGWLAYRQGPKDQRRQSATQAEPHS